MTRQHVNELYEESVYQIRLKVAVALLACPGVNQQMALDEADKFIRLLMTEDLESLRNKYK